MLKLVTFVSPCHDCEGKKEQRITFSLEKESRALFFDQETSKEKTTIIAKKKSCCHRFKKCCCSCCNFLKSLYRCFVSFIVRD